MTTWYVEIAYSAVRRIEVEADTQTEAEAKALNKSRVALCNDCSHKIDLGDAYEITESWSIPSRQR